MSKYVDPIYIQMARAMLEKKTFTLMDLEGAPHVGWVIAKYILKDELAFYQYTALPDLASKVQRNIPHMIEYLKGKGIHVYKSCPEGTKTIDKISIEADFIDLDYRRIEQLLIRNVGSKINEIKDKHQPRLASAQQRIMLETIK